jgi:hypothetical protein
VKSLRRYQNLRVTLLLAGILLAAQTLLLWHTHHDGKATPDETCQLCLHAQHHTPAPATMHAPMLALFTQIETINPVNSDTLHSVYHYYTPSRAPPALFLG